MSATVRHSRKANSFLFRGMHSRNKSVHKLRHLCLFPLNKYDPACASVPLPLTEQVGNSASGTGRASPTPIPKRCWGLKRFQVPATTPVGTLECRLFGHAWEELLTRLWLSLAITPLGSSCEGAPVTIRNPLSSLPGLEGSLKSGWGKPS